MRVGTRWAIGALALGVAACGSDGAPAGSGAPPCAGETCDPPPAPASCADELRPAADGVGCAAVLPAQACPPGSMPVLGSETCAPVGWSDCPPGFAVDDVDLGGRGCRAIIPTRACSGATRDALGGECLPVGDCGAAFPPADATHFVDAGYGPEELDDTHFAELVPALQAAPAGSVIAVESGAYSATLLLDRSLTVVGRCAAEVVITGDGDHIGFLATGTAEVSLRGITMRSFIGAVTADHGGRVAVEDSVFEVNGLSSVVATGPATQVSLTRSVVRGTTAVGDNGGAGVLAQDGGRVSITESALVGNALSNLTAFEAGSEVVVERSVLRDGVIQPVGAFAGDGGYGIYVYRGGHAEVRETAIRNSATAGIQAMHPSKASPTVVSSVVVERSDVTTVVDNETDGPGRALALYESATGVVSSSTLGDASDGAVVVSTGASGTLSGVTVVGSVTAVPASGHGLYVSGGTLDVEGTVVTRYRFVAFGAGDGGALRARDCLAVDAVAGEGKPTQAGALGAYSFGGSTLTLERSALVGPIGVGLFADGEGATVRLLGTLVSGVQANADGAFGRGAVAQDGASLSLERSALVDLRDVGVVLIDGAASATLADSLVGPVDHATDGGMGHGVVAIGGSRLLLERTTVARSANVGLVVSGSGAFVRGSWLKGNAVGVQVQDGSVLRQADAASTEPADVVISSDTAFVDNGSRVGSGVIALPTPVGP